MLSSSPLGQFSLNYDISEQIACHEENRDPMMYLTVWNIRSWIAWGLFHVQVWPIWPLSTPSLLGKASYDHITSWKEPHSQHVAIATIRNRTCVPWVSGTNPVDHHDVLRGPLAGIVPNVVRYRLISHSTVASMTSSLAGLSTFLQEHAFISVVLHFMSQGDAAVIVETLAPVRLRTWYRSGFLYIGTESTTTSDKC